MEPNSNLLLVLLLLAGGGLLFAAIRVRFVAVKVVSGLLAMVMSMVAGIAIVNDYYGYYQTWSQLSADLSGSYDSYSSTPTVQRIADNLSAGGLQTVTISGRRSGISRKALVYLPPQYFQARYAHTTFPVLELMHGSPGRPSDWTVHMSLKAILDQMIAARQIGPMIVVMPTINGRHYQDCVDAKGALDDTYLTEDVRQYVLGHYRADSLGAEWGVGGYSSGGYCAANLSLRHRAAFGAAGIMDGYFRPTDGPAARALNDDPAAEAANDPLLTASRLPADTSPLPSFWVSAGSGDAQDMAAAQAFVKALRGLDQVNLYRESDAGHTFYAWRAAIPPMLTWMWSQIASPQLRVEFPVVGGVFHSTILSEPIAAGRHPAKPKTAHPSTLSRAGSVAEPRRAPR